VASAKVVSRLRKLLALSRSGNAHEASSARSKADEYMARHGLQESDAAVAGEDEVVEVPVGSRGFEEPWKFKLATVAARRYGCEALGRRLGRRRTVRLVGVRDEVARAVKFFKTLELEVVRVARLELEGVVEKIRGISPGHVRRLSERYLRYFREGLVDGVAASLLRREKSRRGGSPPPVDWSRVPAGGVVEVSEARVEGLVRVAPGSVVREKLKSSGVRVVEGDEYDDVCDGGDFDELAEVAYCSGFRQASSVRVKDGGCSE
jgi:hypothetical protein